ncbi:MAG: PKD-like domain-containing protein [Flavisolibacter sp.]
MRRSKIYPQTNRITGLILKKPLRFFLLFCCLMTAGLFESPVWGQVAPVSPPKGQFKIDGALRANVTTAFGDWIPRVNGTAFSSGLDSFVLSSAGVPKDPTTSGLERDLYNTTSDSVFATGSKFNDSIGSLHWATSSAPTKNDINNALYHVASDPSLGDQWAFIAGDRFSTSGTSYIDFEFLQGTLTVNPNGSFTGSGPNGGRTIGDINVSMEYTNGGAKPNVIIYRWAAAGGGGYFWDSTGTASYATNGIAFAETNRNGAVDVPFLGFGLSSYPQYAFVEAAVDITRLLSSGSNCQGLKIKTLWVKTKASASSTAALKDFMRPLPVTFNFGSVSISNPGNMCVNHGPVTLQGTPAGGTFSGPGVSGNTFDPSVAGVGTFKLYYQVSLGLSCTKRDSTQVTVYPLPTANINGNATVCTGDATPFVVLTGSTGTRPYTFGYTLNDGSSTTSLTKTTTGSFDTVKIAVPTTAAGTFTYTLTSVTDVNSCTNTASGSAVITVNPIPTVTKPGNQVKCNATGTDAITFSGTNATSFTWTNDNTSIGLLASGTGNIASFTATNSGSAAVTATITVTPHFTGGGKTCDGASQTFTITVNPTPTVTKPANQTKCNSAGTDAINFSGTAATSYTWTNDNTTIGLAASGSGNITSFTAVNSGATAQVAHIVVTPHFTGGGITCDGSTQSFTITVNPSPTVNDPTDQTLCNNTATTAVNFSGSVSGATYSWTNDNTSIGLAASGSGNIASFTAANSGSTAVIATITVTPSANGCTGASQTFTITVKPTPTVGDPADQLLCTGSSTSAVHFTGAVSGTSFGWTNNNTSIGLGASGTGDIASFTATNSGTSAAVATIVVTPSANGCTGSTQSFTITVNEQPVAPTICMVQPSLCGPATGSIKVTNPIVSGYQYSKDNGTTWQDCNVFLGLAAGSNPVIRYKTGLGCVSKSSTCSDATICAQDPVACPSGGLSTKAAPKQVSLSDNTLSVVAYPNPFSDKINFVISAPFSGKGSLEIYNMLGQKVGTVYQGMINRGNQNFALSIPARRQANLVYILRVGDQQVTGKLLQLNK